MSSSFFQDIINYLRGKKKTLKQIKKENSIQINKYNLKYVVLNIKGKNNKVIIEDDVNFGKHAKLEIEILGDNNTLIIKKGFFLVLKLHVMLAEGVNNSKFIVGENTHMMSVEYVTINSNTYCTIGNDCMFGTNVLLFNTDAHPIIDLTTKKLVNKIKGITINNHCWIGTDAKIMKNSIVPEDSIVGHSSVFATSKYKDNKHCAFAGNPARLIKENITWDKDCNKFNYIENI